MNHKSIFLIINEVFIIHKQFYFLNYILNQSINLLHPSHTIIMNIPQITKLFILTYFNLY